MQYIKQDKINITVKNNSSVNQAVTIFGQSILGVGELNQIAVEYNVESGLLPYVFAYSNSTNRFYLGKANNIYVYSTAFVLLDTINVAYTPSFIFENPVNNELLVGNASTSTITRYNQSAFASLGTFALTISSPSSCGYNPTTGNLYFVRTNSGSIELVNATTYILGTTITLTAGGVGMQIQYNATNQSMYIANRVAGANGNLMIVDNADAGSEISDTNTPNSATYNSSNGYLYYTRGLTNEIVVLDSTNAVVNTVAFTFTGLDDLVYNVNDGYLYALFVDDNVIVKLDSDLAIIDTYYLSGVNDADFMIYGNNGVYTLDTADSLVYKTQKAIVISGSNDGLGFLNSDVFGNPIVIEKVHIVPDTIAQLSNEWSIVKQTAGGMRYEETLQLACYFSANTKQKVVEIEGDVINQYVFDGNRYIELTINAYSYMSVTMYVKQFRQDMLMQNGQVPNLI